MPPCPSFVQGSPPHARPAPTLDLGLLSLLTTVCTRRNPSFEWPSEADRMPGLRPASWWRPAPPRAAARCPFRPAGRGARMKPGQRRLVVVGNGMAGARVVEEILQRDAEHFHI